jgi:hypothetical protein
MTSDWRKDRKQLYFPPTKQVVEVDVPPLKFFTVVGEGNPNVSKMFQEAVEALYSMSYTLKFMIKKVAPDKDFKVGPLEGLWWNKIEGSLEMGRKEDWMWKAMILQPDFMDEALTEKVRSEVLRKKENPLIRSVFLENIHEGKCAQITYIGPWDKEAPTIERVHEFIKGRGGRPNGKHHEIYMSDPRRVTPDKLKTVVRQPFA